MTIELTSLLPQANETFLAAEDTPSSRYPRAAPRYSDKAGVDATRLRAALKMRRTPAPMTTRSSSI